MISTFCNHTIFGDDVVFRYIICINYADNILFMHHIYNVHKKNTGLGVPLNMYFITIFFVMIRYGIRNDLCITIGSKCHRTDFIKFCTIR